jgi:amidophosphoribosyltransferase
VDRIANSLELSSLTYQSAEELVKAIGLPRESLCLYCWTGKSRS